jgi:hypothetical protein
MFTQITHELSRLQVELDRDRALLERARQQEESQQQPAAKFCMSDLYVILPGGDCTPMRIDAYR